MLWCGRRRAIISGNRETGEWPYVYIHMRAQTYIQSRKGHAHPAAAMATNTRKKPQNNPFCENTLYCIILFDVQCEQYKVGRLHIQLFGGSIEYLMRCSVLIISGRTGRVIGAAGGRMMLKLTLFLTNIFILFVHQQNSSYFDRYLKKTIILNYKNFLL